MLLRKLVVVGLVGFVSFAANIATAEDAAAPSAIGADGVSFVDAGNSGDTQRLQLNIGVGPERRFTGLNSPMQSRLDNPDYRRYEVALVARTAAGIDVAFAQRGGVGFNGEGDVDRQSRSAELRLGRGLRNLPRDRPSSTPSMYIFAASEDEALIWRPGARSAFGGAGAPFALQDRVEIGDVQAGITYEVNGLQASLAYVQREISARTGGRTISHDEDFTGLTLTMRH